MNAAFTAVLALLALVVFAIRPSDTDARTPRQLLDAIRAAGWGQRILWLFNTCFEMPLWVAYAAVRTGLYLAALALAWAACKAATLLALDGRAVRLLHTPRAVCA